jgi:hypothetical protein
MTRLRLSGPGKDEKTSLPDPSAAMPLTLDRKRRVYSAFLRLATDFTQGSTWASYLFETPQWIQSLEKAGINVNTLMKQRIAWLGDESQALKYLTLRFSEPTLISAGLLDGQGEFRFARHRILVPFMQGSEVIHFVGLDPETGFHDILSPTRQWPAPYPAPHVKSDPQPRQIYLTPSLYVALRLCTLGKPAWAAPSPNVLQRRHLEQLRGRDVIFCTEGRQASNRVLDEFMTQLSGTCRAFKWQSLSHVETEWLVVQTREERAQPIEQARRFAPPEPHLVKRMIDSFRRRGGKMKNMLF